MKTAFGILTLVSVFSLIATLFFGISIIPIISAHMILFSMAGYFIWEKDWKTTRQRLGLDKDIPRKIAYGLIGYVILLIIGVATSLIAQQFGPTDATNIVDKLQDLPIYIIVFSFVFAPISEELFYRGFLTARFGILISSVVFALSHVLYGSYFEIFGAFVLGIALAIAYKHSKSILTVIVMHALFNATSILVMVMQGALKFQGG